MKKLLLLCAFGFVLSASGFAQDETAYSQGQSTVSLGYGVGNIWKKLFKLSGMFSGGNYKTTSTGPYSFTYEYGVAERISIGLGLSYCSVSGKYTDPTTPADNYDEKLTNFSIIARGNYHFGQSDKFDPYIGLGVGYYSFKYTYKDGSGSTTNNLFAVPGAFGFNGQLGARYYFIPAVGVFAEVGYVAGGFGQAGVVFKF